MMSMYMFGDTSRKIIDKMAAPSIMSSISVLKRGGFASTRLQNLLYLNINRRITIEDILRQIITHGSYTGIYVYLLD